jgi:hypothetical protein
VRRDSEFGCADRRPPKFWGGNSLQLVLALAGECNVRLTKIGFHFAHGGLPGAKGLGGVGKTAKLPLNV